MLKDAEAISDIKLYKWANAVIDKAFDIINTYASPLNLHLGKMEFNMPEMQTFNQIFDFALGPQPFLEDIYKTLINPTEFNNSDSLIIGFSINNLAQLINAIILSSQLKTALPKAHLFLGGAFITTHVRELVGCTRLFDSFNSICIGDGETALKNLHTQIIQNGSIDSLLNIVTRTNYKDESVYNSILIEDIKSAQMPCYADISFERYLSPIRLISLPVTRGCYGSCTFCNYTYHKSSVWREQQIDNIIETIRMSIQLYHSHYFFFSVAALSPKLALLLSKRLIDEEIKIKWATGIRMEKQFDESLIELMARAGCIRLDIGVESASQSVLNAMNKKTEAVYFVKMLKSMKKHGILSFLYLISNFPNESLEEWNETMAFLEDIKADIMGFSVYDFMLTPNTYIWDHPEEFDLQYETFGSESDDLYIKLKRFQTKISKETTLAKEALLDEYYNRNKCLFVRYGNTLLLKGMPINLAEQMVFKMVEHEDEPSKSDRTDYFTFDEKTIRQNINTEMIYLFNEQSMKGITLTASFYKHLELLEEIPYQEWLELMKVKEAESLLIKQQLLRLCDLQILRQGRAV